MIIKEFKTTLNPLEVYNIFKNEINTILLDSSKEDKDLSKYSFIGINPFLIFESYGEDTYINGEKIAGNPFEILEGLLVKYKYEDNREDIPLKSGAIGYISYDTGRTLEVIPDTSAEDFSVPDMRFVFYKNIIAFDLINNKNYLTSIGDGKELIEIICRIENGKKLAEEYIEEKDTKFISNFTKDEYKKAITKLKDYITAGDVYIANMTQRFTCECSHDPFQVYKNLRTINKAPFAAYMNFADFKIISSSPERFIQVKDKKAHTRPIKGTRPRSQNPVEDEKNKQELINSEKDKAELLMVVDLERNDFSKVCKKNTVKVTELFALEEYATVFHLVSTVEGELQDEVSAVKCMKECFPGGSITGTPKIRAMEIIEELEGLKRNIYTGAMGYFDFNGNSDFNIAIRTIVQKDNKAYFGVGGGITCESDEEEEYNETLDKAKALMKVL